VFSPTTFADLLWLRKRRQRFPLN